MNLYDILKMIDEKIVEIEAENKEAQTWIETR